MIMICFITIIYQNYIFINQIYILIFFFTIIMFSSIKFILSSIKFMFAFTQKITSDFIVMMPEAKIIKSEIYS
jgi:hypothetical protein